MSGSWWPRSRRVAEEFTPLVPELQRWHAPIARLMVSTSGWDSLPARLQLGDQVVALSWLGLYRHLLVATYDDGRRVSLLVIPPGTDPAVVESAIAITLDTSNTLLPHAVLARAAWHAGPAP